MIRRKQRSLVFFFAAYLTFFALLIMLLVYTPGLEFEESEGKVYLKNNSAHMVKNVKVQLADGTPIDCIAELEAGSVKKLYVPEAKRPARIIAMASFHPPAEKTLFPLGGGFRLEAKIEVPGLVAVGKEFALKLRLRAENSDLETLSVRESHEQNFIKKESQSKVIALSRGEWATLEYLFTPVKAGATTIRFTLEGKTKEGKEFVKVVEQEITVG